MERRTGLILALDVTEKERALRIVSETSEYLDAVKVNYPLALSCGMGIVRELSKENYVLCDFKVADIPNTNRLIVEQVVSHGAGGVICHAFAGSDSVKACVDAAKGRDVFAVTEMSHPGGREFTARHADDLAKVAVEAGAAGVIAPATRPERIAHIRKIIGSLKILSPGVGAQGGSAGDAIKHGADHIIVGRSIYESAEPRKAAKALAEEARKLF